MMNKLVVYFLMLTPFVSNAQEKDKNLPEGNENFKNKNYVEAEANYRLSQSKFKKKAISSYNLGTSIYKQNQPLEAKYQFEKAIEYAKTKTEKHKAYHNLGNSLMKDKDYSNAVNAYENALRNNPKDEETRYNYALAKKMLKENPAPPKNDDKGKNKKQDNKEDKKEDKKDKTKNENQDKGNENPPKPKPSGTSKQKIDNLLDAVNNEEKKVQEKVNSQKAQGNPVRPEKDW